MTDKTSRQTKAERREAAKAEAQRLREAQRAKERRTKLLAIGGSVAALAALVAVVIVVNNQGTGAPPEEVLVPVALEEVTRPVTSEVIETPVLAGFEDRFTGGIPVGADGVAGTTSGEEAVVVDVYSDYMCPICAAFEVATTDELAALREAGEITVVYHPIAILDRYANGTMFSTRSAAAAGLVADQAPEQFVAFHEAMYDNQPEEYTRGLSNETIGEIALGVGVPQSVVDQLDAWPFVPWVVAATTRAAEMDVTGTPTVFVDGQVFSGDWRVAGALTEAVQAAASARG